MQKRPQRNHTPAFKGKGRLPPSRAIGHWRSLPSSSMYMPIRLPRGKRSLRAALPMCSVLVAARPAARPGGMLATSIPSRSMAHLS
jgi:hypothetical protein